jgi:NAD(P)-dependent dehydrogenase (short-subunit alcohol dehydrogenase family)
MQVENKIIIVTGAASGIGKAMAERFARDGARGLVLADLNGAGVEATAKPLGAIAVQADVTNEADVQKIARAAEEKFGGIDLFCSNAGISRSDPDIDNAASAPNEAWALAWGVNVMAHVYAARAALPGMIARGQGYFLNTVSAAGLLSQIGSAVYSTTKHAAVGFSEHLAIAEREKGIGVSILCPQAVDTPMLGGAAGSQNVDGVLSPDQVADAVVQGLADERFLILPHPQVTAYMQRKTGDYDRWLKGMVRLRRSVIEGAKGAR